MRLFLRLIFAKRAAILPLLLGLTIGSCSAATGSTSEMDQDEPNLGTADDSGGASQSGPRGMTWALRHVEGKTGAVAVGCGGEHDCDPYQGDTVCTTALPVLCFLDLDAQRPFSIGDNNQYLRWSGGLVHTTAPYAASDFATIADADAVCVQEFGPGWRVAEFHDGWGWNFTAYGNVGEPQNRFWVDINDQPNGTCWSH